MQEARLTRALFRRQFYFYPIRALERVFRGRTPAGAGLHAYQVLERLLLDRFSAVEALQKHREGIRMGHTVVVLASVPKLPNGAYRLEYLEH